MQTPLHCAAWRNNSDVVKILVENGADVNAKDKVRVTLLYSKINLKKREKQQKMNIKFKSISKTVIHKLVSSCNGKSHSNLFRESTSTEQ